MHPGISASIFCSGGSVGANIDSIPPATMSSVFAFSVTGCNIAIARIERGRGFPTCAIRLRVQDVFAE